MRIFTLLKCLLAGFVAAIVVPIAWVLAGFGLALVRLAMLSRSDSGGLGAVSTTLTEPALYVAPVAFGLGFYWQFRRSSCGRAR